MIEGMANTASNVVNQVRPLAPEISSSVQKLTDSAGNLIKGAMSGLGMEAVGNAMANAMKTAGMVATGNKVDFPQIWASSSYSPSYKFTTLLYNPWPDDPSIGNEDYCYNKYIVEPLSHLMAFIMPISADGVSYTYPVLCGAYGGGLFNVNAGYIETFDINIGGANSDISFLQRPNIIEVDFTIRHLYSTMIGYVSDGISSKQISEERPSFKGFVSGLRSFAVIESKEYDLNDNIVNNVVNIANNVDRIVRRNINDNNTDILFDSDGRLNVSDEINSSDPALLNDEDIPPELQQNVQNYKRDMQLLIDSGVTITPQIQIALRLRNGLQSYVPDATIAQFLTNIDDYPDKVIINEIMKDVNIDGVYSNPQIATTSEGEL
jgi:hypothetical protein